MLTPARRGVGQRLAGRVVVDVEKGTGFAIQRPVSTLTSFSAAGLDPQQPCRRCFLSLHGDRLPRRPSLSHGGDAAHCSPPAGLLSSQRRIGLRLRRAASVAEALPPANRDSRSSVDRAPPVCPVGRSAAAARPASSAGQRQTGAGLAAAAAGSATTARALPFARSGRSSAGISSSGRAGAGAGASAA